MCEIKFLESIRKLFGACEVCAVHTTMTSCIVYVDIFSGIGGGMDKKQVEGESSSSGERERRRESERTMKESEQVGINSNVAWSSDSKVHM